MKYTFQTDSAAEGLRIDACIRRFLPELPSRAAQEAFSHRDVKLDGKRVKPDMRVHAGQCVEVFCMEQTAPLLDVVYEDADVLLVNKRAGISVEADEKGGVTLTELAARHVRQQAPDARAPKACHRLDNQTCGLLMFANLNKANDTSYNTNGTSYDANDTSSNEHGQRLTKETLINRVLELCEDWITIDEISEKTGKSRQYLRGRIIPEMLKLGLLEKQYPDASTSPNQKYRKKQ